MSRETRNDMLMIVGLIMLLAFLLFLSSKGYGS